MTKQNPRHRNHLLKNPKKSAARKALNPPATATGNAKTAAWISEHRIPLNIIYFYRNKRFVVRKFITISASSW